MAVNIKTGRPLLTQKYSRLEVLKLKLDKTLQSLPPGSEFCVILYNEKVHLTPLGLRWAKGASRDVVHVSSWIKSNVYPKGGTKPFYPFQVAFDFLNPRPDVIFYLSDGVIDVGTGYMVYSMNKKKTPLIPVNTIEFMNHRLFMGMPFLVYSGGSLESNELYQIARYNGGNIFFYKVFLNGP